MNNYTSVYTEAFQTFEHKQKFSKKSKSYDNTGRKGDASSNTEVSCKQDCKQSYKHIRSRKREWRGE